MVISSPVTDLKDETKFADILPSFENVIRYTLETVKNAYVGTSGITPYKGFLVIVTEKGYRRVIRQDALPEKTFKKNRSLAFVLHY